MRTAILAAACLAALVCLAQVAGAEPMDDCRQNRDPRAKLAACSAVIADTGLATADRAFALRTRGGLRLEAGALDQAVADLTDALVLSPSDDRALVLRAQARMGRNDMGGALADYGAAIALNPSSAVALNGRGYARLAGGDAAGAIADFTQVIQISPISAVAFNNRGLAWRKAGNVDRAIEDFTAAITLNPVYALAFNNRGYAREAKGDKPFAIADFRRALVIDPTLAGAREGLARLGVAVEPEAERLVAEGRALVEAHCSRCHATRLEGDSPNARAPAFRSLHGRHPILALREPLTRGIAAPHDEMPHFALPETEVEKIVAYINSLSQKR